MTSDGASGAASGIATTLQKLPQLDTEHLKAITASFPGRLLGRSAALLSLAALLLGWFKLVDWALPQELLSFRVANPRLFNAAYYGIPILIVLGQLVREALEARRKKRMAARVIEGVVADPTYFRLSPYSGSAHDRERYRRADKADERVAEWVEKTRAPILFLTGDSGVGKSSLLAAGALPRLAEKGFDVVAVRAFSDPIAAMLDALAANGLTARRVAGDVDALSALQQSTRRLARHNRRLLVIIDQAEELLVVMDNEPRARFLDLLQRITAEPLTGLVVLFVLRSEYEPALAELGLPALSHGETWFKVGAFAEPAARAFLEGSGLRLAEGQLLRVLKGAAALEQTQGLYRPIVLNMLGLILARFAGSLPEHLDLERLIQHHLRECITRSDLADDARLALPAMITEAGTKWPRGEVEIAEAAGRPIGNVRHCLQTLALPDAGIVRALGRQQAVVWEIAHDFLALQLGLLLGRLKRSWWRRVLPYTGPVLALAWLIVLGGIISAPHQQQIAQDQEQILLLNIARLSWDRTVNFNISSREFTQHILTPVTEDVVAFFLFQGVRIELLARLMGDGIQMLTPDGREEQLYFNKVTVPDQYRTFRQIVLHLGSVQQRRQLFVNELTFDQVILDRVPQPSTGDIVSAQGGGLTWKRNADGTFTLFRAIRGRILISNYDPRSLGVAERERLNEIASGRADSFVLVDVQPEYPGGDFPIFGALRLRSLFAMLDFVAKGIELFPEFPVEPDPRTTGEVRNPVRTLAIDVHEEWWPLTADIGIRFEGRFYAVGNTRWDRAAFQILYQLVQVSLPGTMNAPDNPPID